MPFSLLCGRGGGLLMAGESNRSGQAILRLMERGENASSLHQVATRIDGCSLDCCFV